MDVCHLTPARRFQSVAAISVSTFTLALVIGVAEVAVQGETPPVGPPVPLYCPCAPLAPPVTCAKGGTVTTCVESTTVETCYCHDIFHLCQPTYTYRGINSDPILRGNWNTAICAEDGCAGKCYQEKSIVCSDSRECINPESQDPRACTGPGQCQPSSQVVFHSSTELVRTDKSCCIDVY